jgi:hypothetical protein
MGKYKTHRKKMKKIKKEIEKTENVNPEYVKQLETHKQFMDALQKSGVLDMRDAGMLPLGFPTVPMVLEPEKEETKPETRENISL